MPIAATMAATPAAWRRIAGAHASGRTLSVATLLRFQGVASLEIARAMIDAYLVTFCSANSRDTDRPIIRQDRKGRPHRQGSNQKAAGAVP